MLEGFSGGFIHTKSFNQLLIETADSANPAHSDEMNVVQIRYGLVGPNTARIEAKYKEKHPWPKLKKIQYRRNLVPLPWTVAHKPGRI